MRIRLASAADLPAIMDIYNEQVLNGVATFDTEPIDSPEARRAWLEKHPPDRHPALVAEEDGRVIGWATLSRWSERCAYNRAAEVSEYVRKDRRGKGVGTALLNALISQARTLGLGVLLARIAAPGEASLKLHSSLGFTRIGTMRRVGEKFGRTLDVELMEMHLDLPPSTAPAAPRAQAARTPRPLVDSIIRAWEDQRAYAQRLVADVPEAEMVAQPVAGVTMNHPAWILAHLGVYAPVLEAVVCERSFEDPANHRFGGKSRPMADLALYPRKGELLSALAQGYDRVAAACAAADERVFAVPAPLERWRARFPTIADICVQLVVKHMATHLGQLSAWRRAGGRPPV